MLPRCVAVSLPPSTCLLRVQLLQALGLEATQRLMVSQEPPDFSLLKTSIRESIRKIQIVLSQLLRMPSYRELSRRHWEEPLYS